MLSWQLYQLEISM